MAHKEAQKGTNTEVVISTTKRKFKKTWVLYGVAAVLVIGLLGYGYYWKFVQKDLYSGKNVDYGKVPAEAQKIREAGEIAQNGNVAQSKQAFETLANNEKNPVQKAAYYRSEATMCAAKKDYTCAIEANNKSLQITGDTANELIANGDYAYASSKKEEGNGYYQRAIVLLKKINTPQAKTSIANLQNIMAGKPVQDQGQ